MYDFLFNPLYMNLFILALLIFLVFFLWRKLTILEGNFFILEKRVNLIKKENRESSVAKNLERSNVVMNEIFSDCVSPEICKKMGTCAFSVSDKRNDAVTIVTTDINVPDKDDVQISFDTDDIDKKIEEAIDPVDIINAIEKKPEIEHDNVSITSDMTFNTDDKYTNKKLSKMNLDKLKDICIQLNLSSDGTKAQLISRILETNK